MVLRGSKLAERQPMTFLLSSRPSASRNDLGQYFSGGQIDKNEMGGACITYGERRGVYRVLVGGNLMEREHLGDPGVDRRIILRWILRK
jgi:hypothetical protein